MLTWKEKFVVCVVCLCVCVRVFVCDLKKSGRFVSRMTKLAKAWDDGIIEWRWDWYACVG